MERGTRWESRAVHERWEQLERERRERLRRVGSRVFGGAFLVLAGLTALLVFLAEEACTVVGPWPHGCMPVIPRTVELVLVPFVPLAVVIGLWLGRTAFRD